MAVAGTRRHGFPSLILALDRAVPPLFKLETIVRKNLSDIQTGDLILKWQFEDNQGRDVYNIYTAADYRVGCRAVGTLVMDLKVEAADLQLSVNYRVERLRSTIGVNDD